MLLPSICFIRIERHHSYIKQVTTNKIINIISVYIYYENACKNILMYTIYYYDYNAILEWNT